MRRGGGLKPNLIQAGGGQRATRNLHSVTPEGPLLWKEDMQLCMQIRAGSHPPGASHRGTGTLAIYMKGI